jgi:hypothetical protein
LQNFFVECSQNAAVTTSKYKIRKKRWKGLKERKNGKDRRKEKMERIEGEERRKGLKERKDGRG